MLRKLLVGATSTALLLGGASVAVAATPEPPVLDVKAQTACGRGTLTAEVTKTFALNDAYELTVRAGSTAEVATREIGVFTVDRAGGKVSKTFTRDEDSFGGDAFVRWVTTAG